MNNTTAAPFAAAYQDFKVAISGAGDKASWLKECDKLRDDILPALGVDLDDKEGKARWRLDEPQSIRDARKPTAEDPNKIRARMTQMINEKTRLQAALIPLTELFKQGDHAGKYSEWDAEGYPTKTAEGEAVPEKMKKKKFSKPYLSHKKNMA